MGQGRGEEGAGGGGKDGSSSKPLCCQGKPDPALCWEMRFLLLMSCLTDGLGQVTHALMLVHVQCRNAVLISPMVQPDGLGMSQLHPWPVAFSISPQNGFPIPFSYLL